MAAWIVKENLLNCATSPGLWTPIARPATPASPKRCLLKSEDLLVRSHSPPINPSRRPFTPTQHPHGHGHSHPILAHVSLHDEIHPSPAAVRSLSPRESSVLERQLLDAAAEGQVEHVERLLAMGVLPECADERGFTALHHASRGGHVEVVKVLLARMRHAAPRDVDERTPHCVAAAEGHYAIMELLLAHRDRSCGEMGDGLKDIDLNI